MYTIQDTHIRPLHRITGYGKENLLKAITGDSLDIKHPIIILDGDENQAFFELVGSDCGHSHSVTLEHPVSTAFVEIIRKKHAAKINPTYARIEAVANGRTEFGHVGSKLAKEGKVWKFRLNSSWWHDVLIHEVGGFIEHREESETDANERDWVVKVLDSLEAAQREFELQREKLREADREARALYKRIETLAGGCDGMDTTTHRLARLKNGSWKFLRLPIQEDHRRGRIVSRGGYINLTDADMLELFSMLDELEAKPIIDPNYHARVVAIRKTYDQPPMVLIDGNERIVFEKTLLDNWTWWTGSIARRAESKSGRVTFTSDMDESRFANVLDRFELIAHSNIASKMRKIIRTHLDGAGFREATLLQVVMDWQSHRGLAGSVSILGHAYDNQVEFVDWLNKTYPTKPVSIGVDPANGPDSFAYFIQAQLEAAATLEADARDVVSTDGKATGVKVLMPAKLVFEQDKAYGEGEYEAHLHGIRFWISQSASKGPSLWWWRIGVGERMVAIAEGSEGSAKSKEACERACNDWVANLHAAMMGDMGKRVQALGDLHQQRADLTGESREVAKEKNFAAIYGSGKTLKELLRDPRFAGGNLREPLCHYDHGVTEEKIECGVTLEEIKSRYGIDTQSLIDAKTEEAKRMYPNCDVTITVTGGDVRVSRVSPRSGTVLPSETLVVVEYAPNCIIKESWEDIIDEGKPTGDPNGWVVTEGGCKATAELTCQAHYTLAMAWTGMGRRKAQMFNGLPIKLLLPLGYESRDSILMLRHPDYTYSLFCPRGVAWALGELGITLPRKTVTLTMQELNRNQERVKLPDSPPPAPTFLPTIREFYGYLAGITDDFAESQGFTINILANNTLEVRQAHPCPGKRLLVWRKGFRINLKESEFRGLRINAKGDLLSYAEAVKWMRWGASPDMLALQRDWFKRRSSACRENVHFLIMGKCTNSERVSIFTCT